MGMRIVWGLWDNENNNTLVALFEAENLLDNYRDMILREAYDNATQPLPEDFIGTPEAKQIYDAQVAERNHLLDLGYDRWRIDEINSKYPRFRKGRHELWNSVPPNVERLVIHFDTGGALV
jgi:hypothetical protein